MSTSSTFYLTKCPTTHVLISHEPLTLESLSLGHNENLGSSPGCALTPLLLVWRLSGQNTGAPLLRIFYDKKLKRREKEAYMGK